jgi:hypothetical protein
MEFNGPQAHPPDEKSLFFPEMPPKIYVIFKKIIPLKRTTKQQPTRMKGYY